MSKFRLAFMLRLLVPALVAALSTLGGVYGSLVLSSSQGAGEGSQVVPPVDSELIEQELNVLPIISAEKMFGYYIVRFGISVAGSTPNKSEISDDLLLSDAFYTAAFSDGIFQENTTSQQKIDVLTENILTSANVSAGSKRYLDIYVLQADIFSKNAVRSRHIQERAFPD